MNKTALLVLLLLAAHSWAAPNSDEYPVNVHFSSSRWFMEPSILGGPIPRQKLDVIIDGKKYELEASTFKANLEVGVTLLALGDYQAKLIQDQHNTTYEASQAYEFLLPDNKTRKFIVVGRTE